jgi:hypothetical protein
LQEDPLDIPERAYALKVREAFADRPGSSNVGVSIDDSQIEDFKKEDVGVSVDESSDMEEGVSGTFTEEELKEKQEVTSASAVDVQSKINTTSEKNNKPHEKILKSRSPISVKNNDSRFNNTQSYSVYQDYSSITPDMHSGRKFINLVPSSGGEIVLPIRGQRVIDTSESLRVKTDLEEKAKKLNDLLDRIRSEEGIIKKIPEKKVEGKDSVEIADREANEVVKKLKKQNEDLTSEIQRLKSQIERNRSMSLETVDQEQLLKKLESQKADIASSYSELSSQVQDLRKKLQEKDETSTGESFIEKSKMQLPVLTNKPNVVSGIVRDSKGSFFSDYLLIIKNSRGDTVRALKTNALGQFVVSTPLQNGTYTVEVSPSNKTDLSFGIIPIEVKGGVIPTLDIVGK